MNKLIKNKPLHVYLDESGDLGKLGSRYFVIALLATEDKRGLDRCIKRLRERKLKKKLKDLSEIKANNSNRIIREYLLKSLVKTKSKIYVIVLDKNTVYDYLFAKKDKIYNYLSGLIMNEIDTNNADIELIVDRKDGRPVVNNDFSRYIAQKLKDKKWNLNIKIEHRNSENVAGLMVTDFVAWAIHRKFSHNEDSYYKIIEKKISVLKQKW